MSDTPTKKARVWKTKDRAKNNQENADPANIEWTYKVRKELRESNPQSPEKEEKVLQRREKVHQVGLKEK